MHLQDLGACLAVLIAWILWPLRKLGSRLGIWAFYENKVVFRVEHETNESTDPHPILREGPYTRRGESIAQHQLISYNDHPTPGQERMEFWWSRHRSAFASRVQFERWFSIEARRKLHEWGFVLRTYRAWVNVGNKQVVIDSHRPLIRLTTEPLVPCNE